MRDDFTSGVLAVVESIPRGRVLTYSAVAAAIGSRAPRAVGQVMAYAGEDVAWWRVVRADGRPPVGLERAARAEYEKEGTPLLQSTTDGIYRVDLRKALWSTARWSTAPWSTAPWSTE